MDATERGRDALAFTLQEINSSVVKAVKFVSSTGFTRPKILENQKLAKNSKQVGIAPRGAWP